MVYTSIPLWKWCARTMDFKPSYSVPDTPFGKRPVVMLTPHWTFDLRLPAKNLEERREIEAVIHGNDGVPTFRVYDARVPYPAVFGVVNDSQIPGGIPALVINSIVKFSSSLTVQGTAGDVLTRGDPIAFTYNGRRHYYKVRVTKTLTGNPDDIVRVFLRPPFNQAGLSIPADRVRPTQAFNVRLNDIDQNTGDDALTRFSLSGTEYWGGV